MPRRKTPSPPPPNPPRDDAEEGPPRSEWSEVDGIKVIPPPAPPRPTPPPPKPPPPQKPPRRDPLTEDEKARWNAVQQWEGDIACDNKVGMAGSLLPGDNMATLVTSRVDARVKLVRARDLAPHMLMWTGGGTLKGEFHGGGDWASPQLGGRGGSKEDGSDSQEVSEGFTLIVNTLDGTYHFQCPSMDLQTVVKTTSGSTGTGGLGRKLKTQTQTTQGQQSLSIYSPPDQALPKVPSGQKPELKGSHKLDAPPQFQIDTTTTWSLKPAQLEAHAGGPYTVERGQWLTLDGSRSRSLKRIKRYTWTFIEVPSPLPNPEGLRAPPPPRADARKERSEPTARILPLADVMVVLEIEDEKGSTAKSEPVLVHVKPRGWQPVPAEARPTIVAELNFDANLYFGKSTCAEDPGPHGRDEEEHYYHRPINEPSWRNTGYKRKAVEDSADGHGPFDGYWYLTEHTLVIARSPVINRKITPQDLTGVYAKNKAEQQPRPARPDTPYICGFDRIRQQVERHERLHGERILRAARGTFTQDPRRYGQPVDPVHRIEPLYAEDEDYLCTRADMEIRWSDDEIRNITAGEEVEREIHAQLVREGFTDIVLFYMLDARGGFKLRGPMKLGEMGD